MAKKEKDNKNNELIAKGVYLLDDWLCDNLDCMKNDGTTGFHKQELVEALMHLDTCLLYTSPSPRDATLSRMPSSA